MFYFHPYFGKIPILTNIFQMGWNHLPVVLWDLKSEQLIFQKNWTTLLSACFFCVEDMNIPGGAFTRVLGLMASLPVRTRKWIGKGDKSLSFWDTAYF